MAEREYPFVVRTSTGPRLRWGRIAVVAAAASLAGAAVLALRWWTHGQPTLAAFVMSAVPMCLALVVVCEMQFQAALRKPGEPRRLRFRLGPLFVLTAIVAVLFAAAGHDRRAQLRAQADANDLRQAVQAIVGSGTVHASSSQVTLQVQRATFGDADLAAIAALLHDFRGSRYELHVLDLAGTQVTDAGLAALDPLQGVRYMSIDRTKITVAGLRARPWLSGVRGLSISNSGVSAKDATQLAADFPETVVGSP